MRTIYKSVVSTTVDPGTNTSRSALACNASERACGLASEMASRVAGRTSAAVDVGGGKKTHGHYLYRRRQFWYFITKPRRRNGGRYSDEHTLPGLRIAMDWLSRPCGQAASWMPAWTEYGHPRYR